MRRAFHIQLRPTESVGHLMPCPVCKGPTDEIESIERFRRCAACAQMVRTQDCGKAAEEAWGNQVIKVAWP